MTTQVNVAALDGGGRATTIRGDLNPDNSIALRSSLEVGGAAVGPSNQVPTADATAGLALGAPADASWSGSGVGSIVAVLKAIWTALTGTLTVKQSAFALTNSASGTMGTLAAIIVPASGTRKWLMITNRTANAETQDIGSSNVTVGGGIPLAPGGGFLFSGAGAAGPIYGITTVAGSPFSYVEG